MQHKLLEEPTFEFEPFLASVSAWKASGATEVVVEWSTGIAPVIFYFPAAKRSYGKKWSVEVSPDGYSELYADLIEYKMLPKVIEALKQLGLAVSVRCVDLQPLQVQRQRRRAIDRETAGRH